VNPNDLRYSETHEWARVEETPNGKVATVGITAFAVELLTDLVHIELPNVGTAVQAGQPFGEVESVKSVSDLNSPVDGEVIEVNDAIVDHLETLSNDPFGEGWLVKVKIADEAGLAQLMDHAAYEAQCREHE
jgi:glycine cleavage system H protein